MSKSSRTWWASTTTNARRTAFGAVAIALCLALASYFVWNSPDSPISPENRLAAQVGPSAAEVRLAAQREELLDDVEELRTQLANAEEKLDYAADGAGIKQADIDALKEQVASANAAVSESNAALADAQAATAAANKRAEIASARPTTVVAAPAPAPSTPSTPVATPITAPSLDEIKNPASRYFGLYTEQAPFNFATFDATATKIGSAPNVVGYFGGWDEAFRPEAVTKAWERDTLPILTWESRPIGAANDVINEPDYELPGIIAGNHDDYIRQYARDIVATGLPLGLRFDHEMNGNWYPWAETNNDGSSINNNNPGDYVKTWQHVHDIFEQEGANQLVSWIWAPNIVNNLNKEHRTVENLAGFFPGDDYVDWVGLSGYLRPPYKEENNFTFEYTFGQSLDLLRQISDKPIFLAEIGASEIEGHKGKWITSLFENLAKPENNDIIGFSWFNLAVTSKVEGERATNDWRIDSRADTLEAFKAGLAVPGIRYSLEPKE